MSSILQQLQGQAQQGIERGMNPIADFDYNSKQEELHRLFSKQNEALAVAKAKLTKKIGETQLQAIEQASPAIYRGGKYLARQSGISDRIDAAQRSYGDFASQTRGRVGDWVNNLSNEGVTNFMKNRAGVSRDIEMQPMGSDEIQMSEIGEISDTNSPAVEGHLDTAVLNSMRDRIQRLPDAGQEFFNRVSTKFNLSKGIDNEGSPYKQPGLDAQPDPDLLQAHAGILAEANQRFGYRPGLTGGGGRLPLGNEYTESPFKPGESLADAKIRLGRGGGSALSQKTNLKQYQPGGEEGIMPPSLLGTAQAKEWLNQEPLTRKWGGSPITPAVPEALADARLAQAKQYPLQRIRSDKPLVATEAPPEVQKYTTGTGTTTTTRLEPNIRQRGAYSQADIEGKPVGTAPRQAPGMGGQAPGLAEEAAQRVRGRAAEPVQATAINDPVARAAPSYGSVGNPLRGADAPAPPPRGFRGNYTAPVETTTATARPAPAPAAAEPIATQTQAPRPAPAAAAAEPISTQTETPNREQETQTEGTAREGESSGSGYGLEAGFGLAAIGELANPLATPKDKMKEVAATGALYGASKVGESALKSAGLSAGLPEIMTGVEVGQDLLNKNMSDTQKVKSVGTAVGEYGGAMAAEALVPGLGEVAMLGTAVGGLIHGLHKEHEEEDEQKQQATDLAAKQNAQQAQLSSQAPQNRVAFDAAPVIDSSSYHNL